MNSASTGWTSGQGSFSLRDRFVQAGGVICVVAMVALLGLSGCNDSQTALERSEDTARTLVHSAAMLISETLPTLSNDQQRVEFIQNFIDPIRFYPDSSGYFYVYTMSCVNIAHATQKNLVGQNLYDYTDTKGKFVIRELSAAAAAGGGFVEYYWIKPGSEGEKLKIGYVEPIPGTDYFIGTGVYLE